MTAIRVDQWKVHLAIKDDWLKAAEKLPAGMLIDIKLDPFEHTPESKGFFLWMKEKSWIAPLIEAPIASFAQSMKAFPPRQKGTGVGAATILSH